MSLSSGLCCSWRSGFLRAGPLGRRIGLRTTGGRDAVAAARLIDRPSRPAGRVAALLDQAAARMGLGVGVANPLAGLEPSLSEFFTDADGAAVVQSSMPGRLIAAISSGGVPRYVLKVGQADDRPLRNEAEFLQTIPGRGLRLAVPKFLFAGLVGERYVVVTLAWPNSRPAGPLERNELLEITEVLGMTASGCGPIVHGDFAPWNVLRTPAGIALVDWERAGIADQPLRDLIHYLVQAGAYLRWHDVDTVVRELTHPQGMVAELAQRLELSPALAREALGEYFRLPPAARTPPKASRFRDRVAVAAGLPPSAPG